MRIALAAIPLLLLGACQVSKDDNNGTASVTYNGDVAANAANDVGAKATTIAGEIGNNVKTEGAKLKDKVDNTNVNLTVGKDHDDGSTNTTKTTTTTTTTQNKSN